MGTSTTVRFNAGGQGTDVSVANAGLSAAPTLNGGTAKFDTAAAGEGTYGLTVISAAGLLAYVEVPFQAESTAGQWTSTEGTFHTPTVAPNVDSKVYQIRNSSGGGIVIDVMYSASTGNLYLQGRTGSSAVTLLAAAPLNTQYDISLLLKPGTATTAPYDGAFTAKLYRHSDRAVMGTASSTTYNISTSQPNAWRLGVLTVLAAAATHKYDTMRAETDRATELGAYSPPVNTPPTIPAIADIYLTVGSGTTVTAAAVDVDGTVASSGGYSWYWISYPGASAPGLTNTANATVTVAAIGTPGTGVLGVVATDNGGAVSAERTVTIYVRAASGTTVSFEHIVSNTGTWVAGGTATDLADGLSDAGEWIMSPAGPSALGIVVGCPPLADTDVVIDFYADLIKTDGTTLADVGQTGTLTAQFFSGTTAISDVVNVAVSRTEAHVTITLSPAQNTAFTSAGRVDPQVQLVATAS